MSNPTYSFIIPHKNAPDFLVRCISSIPERKDIEIIIVDDNSDKSIVDWESFKLPYRSNINTIKTWKGKGAGYARNEGMKKASGKWLLFIDCDDYYCPGFLNVLDKYQDSDADVIYFDYQNVTGDEKKQLSYQPPKDAITDDEREEKCRYKLHMPWNKMLSKSFIDNHHIHFEECINGNDIFFSFQVGFYCKKIHIDPSKIYCYYHNPFSLTKSKNNNEYYYLCVLHHHYKIKNFYKFIGLEKWNQPILKKFTAILYKKGWKQFSLATKVYLKNLSVLKANQFEYTEYFKKNQKRK